ncbi:protein FAM174C [Anableps anableps]
MEPCGTPNGRGALEEDKSLIMTEKVLYPYGGVDFLVGIPLSVNKSCDGVQQLTRRVYEGNFGSVPVPSSEPILPSSSRVELFSDVKMSFWRVLPVLIVPTCWLVLALAADVAPANSTTSPGTTAAPRPAVTNSSRLNNTKKGGVNDFGVDSSMIQRALYVLIGITIIGVLYFLIRAVRLKKPAQRKKYGLLSNYDDSVEMEAVESEEDDTLYEARSLRR